MAALLVLYLLARAVLASRTPRGLRHWQVLTAGAVVLAALVVSAFLANPFSFLSAYGVMVSASFGAYLALVMAAAAVVGGIVSRPAADAKKA